MYLYIGLYWFWAGVAYVARARRYRRALALLFALFLMVFAGSRLHVGCDTAAYEMRFSYLYQGMSWLDAMHMGEGGFNWLNMAIIEAGGSFRALLMVCAILFVGCLYRFATIAERPLSFLVLAFPVLVLQLGMSGLRQALATAFLMLAMGDFIRKRRSLTALWIVVASQFHTSALIFLPMILLVGKNVSTKKLLGAMALLGPLALFFLGDRLEIYSDRYVSQIYGSQESDGAWYRYAIAVVPFILLEWKRRLVKERYPDLFPILHLFALLTFVLSLAGLVSSVALHRFVFYVMPVSILALLCIGETILRREQWRMATALPFIAYGAYITVWFTLSSHSTVCYVPYQTWLLGSGS